MTDTERTACLVAATLRVRQAKDVVILEGLPCQDFAEALRERAPRVMAAPGLIVFGAALTLWGWLSPAWSAPGWRHVMLSMFGHASLIGLLVCSACLLQVAL